MREQFLCIGQPESGDCDISEYKNTRDVIHFALVFAWHSFPSLRTRKSSPSRDLSLSLSELKRGDPEGRAEADAALGPQQPHQKYICMWSAPHGKQTEAGRKTLI